MNSNPYLQELVAVTDGLMRLSVNTLVISCAALLLGLSARTALAADHAA